MKILLKGIEPSNAVVKFQTFVLISEKTRVRMLAVLQPNRRIT